jgi:hypothetical protein
MANLSNINNKFLVTTGGSVGIGTTSPTQLLHVNSSTNNPTGIGLQNSERYYAVRSNNYSLVFSDETVGLERMRIDSSGGVSITPTTSTSFFYGADGTNSYINFETNNIDATVQLYAGYSSGGFFSIGTKNSAGTLAEKMRVTGDGNVGIGTTGPFSKLQVGTATFSGGHGMYADSRVGISNHGALTGLMLASTYNDATHPEYGLVFVQGPNTSSYNVWSISPDGPAKGSGLCFNYQLNSTNIHPPANTKVYFEGSTGFVGIGTDAPGEKLTVAGKIEIKSGNWIVLRNSDNSNYGSIRGASDTSNDITINTNSEVIRFEQNGNVGIGRSAADYKLVVSNSNAEGIEFGPGYSAGKNLYQNYNRTSGAYVEEVHYASTYSFLTSGGNTGNVGIGTDSPTRELHIKAADGAQIKLESTSTGDWSGIDLAAGNGSYSAYWGILDGNGNFFLDVGSNGTDLTVLQNGNVGIGYTGPSKKLSVNGGVIMGANGTDAGASKIYGDIARPQASNYIERIYRINAGSSAETKNLARQWHDVINWGQGNINVIAWGTYPSASQYNKGDFTCAYGYSGDTASVTANFNGGTPVPYWSSSTTVSGNIKYRDLKFDVPAYEYFVIKIIILGPEITYDINNASNNRVYLYPY